MKSLNSEFYVVLISLASACSAPSRIAPSHSLTRFNEAALRLPNEALLEIRNPEKLANQILAEIIRDGKTPITRFDGLTFSPVNGLVTLKGRLELPKELFLSIDKKLSTLPLEFQLAFTPKIRALQDNSWLALQFQSLTLNGQEFIQVSPIVANVMGALLSSSTVSKFIEDSQNTLNQVLAETEVSVRVKRLFEHGSIKYIQGTQTLLVKINLPEIVDLSRLKKLDNYQEYLSKLRLWYFGPMLEAGTSNSVFYLAMGFGQPSGEWSQNLRARLQQDTKFLLEGKAEMIAELSKVESLIASLQAFFDASRRDMGLPTMSLRQRAEFEAFVRTLRTRANAELSVNNPLFVADPLAVYESLTEFFKSDGVALLSEIARQNLKEADAFKVTDGALGTNEWPILSQRFSQKTLSQVIRYARDVEIKGQKLVKDLNVILNPSSRGLLVRGRLRLDIAKLNLLPLPAGTEIPLHRDLYGDSVPFTLALGILMQSDGNLRLDLKSLTLFSDSQTLRIDSRSKNGSFVFELANRLLDQALAQQVLSVPAGVSPEDMIAKLNAEKLRNRAQLKKLAAQFEEIRKVKPNTLDYMNLDRANNPAPLLFPEPTALPAPDSQAKKLVLSDYVKYDGNSILLGINPEILSYFSGSVADKIYVWNMEPIFSSKLGRSYLDLSAGTGLRSKTYVACILTRPEVSDSQFFAAERDDAQGADLIYEFRLDELTRKINAVLTDARDAVRADAEKKLSAKVEQKIVIIDEITMAPKGSQEMSLNIKLTLLEKGERSYFNPGRYFSGAWYQSSTAINVQADVAFATDLLDKYRDKILIGSRSVFLGHQVVKLDVRRASIITGKYSYLQDVLALMGLDVKKLDFEKSTLARKIKRFLMVAIAGSLDDKTSIGNTQLGGLGINQWLRVFVHEEELLLQINPKASGTAFEIVLPMDNANSSAMQIDTSRNILEIAFNTKASLSNTDKQELLDIASDLDALMTPYRKAQNTAEFEALTRSNELFDRLLYNSDVSKMSLLHRFVGALAYYPEISDLTKNSEGQFRKLLLERLRVINESSEKQNLRSASECGLELMYFATVARKFQTAIDDIIHQTERFGLSAQFEKENYLNNFRSSRDEITLRFLDSLMLAYRDRHLTKNRVITSSEPTDWTQAFYADALAARYLYEALK